MSKILLNYDVEFVLASGRGTMTLNRRKLHEAKDEAHTHLDGGSVTQATIYPVVIKDGKIQHDEPVYMKESNG